MGSDFHLLPLNKQIEQTESMVRFYKSAPQTRRTEWQLATYKKNLSELKKKKELAE